MAAAKTRNGPELALLRDLLDDYGKQAPLADALDVNESTVFRWLSGASYPQARHGQRIVELHRSRRYDAALKRAIEGFASEEAE